MSNKSEPTYLENTDETIKTRGLLGLARYTVGRWGLLGTIARFLLIKSETTKFTASGCGGHDKKTLRNLMGDFQRIQNKVHCAHSPYQFVLMAKQVLELDVEGPIVECGCFKGGGSAKLSLLAKMTGRKLIVCDSFAGLPAPKDEAEAHLDGYGSDAGYLLEGGQYAGALDEVKSNIKNHGCIDVCSFVPGFFEDSLKNLDEEPACVIMDVDLISSAKDCLQYLWPQTKEGGLWFTHEACYPNYITGIFEPDWWKTTLNTTPPVVFGAGSGLSECANGLAYFVKTR